MNYAAIKISDAMKKITENGIYLPAIQRKFVWETDRIERLFDSIIRGYPIGTFLFWFVSGDYKDKYTFYKFIQNFHERDRCWNEIAPKPELRFEIIGVLDGQQRLNSMYVALQGSYAYKRRKARRTNNAAYPERFLYLNLLSDPQKNTDQEEELAYEFSFLTDEEARRVDAEHCWFLVKTVLGWLNSTPVFATIQGLQIANPDLKQALQERGAQNLTLLWQRLCSDDVINFFSVHEQDLDKVVDIFVRVNSAGLPLSKTDLLFSSIVAHWEAGRTEIESCIAALNNKGNRFTFDNDFVMRCCLVLTDVPVRFKLESFKQENIERIRTGWDKIEKALHSAVDLLVEWGFNGETLPAQNAIIPIVYFIYKGGVAASGHGVWRKYLIRALLNQIYSSQTDRVISAYRDHLRKEHYDGEKKVFKLTDQPITLDGLVAVKLPGDKTLAIDDDDIDQILDYEKGPYTFMVLSLLYAHLRFDQVQFHQDHIHPRSRFNKQVLGKLGVADEKTAKWQDLRDRLPNLQLMEGGENENKRAKPFDEWLDASGLNKPHFLVTNYIPDGVSLSLKDFEASYGARKSLLRDKIKTVLNA